MDLQSQDDPAIPLPLQFDRRPCRPLLCDCHSCNKQFTHVYDIFNPFPTTVTEKQMIVDKAFDPNANGAILSGTATYNNIDM